MLDVLSTRFPSRQLGRVLLFAAGAVVVAWGGNQYRVHGYPMDLLVCGGLGVIAFYLGLRLERRASELPLVEILRLSRDDAYASGPALSSVVTASASTAMGVAGSPALSPMAAHEVAAPARFEPVLSALPQAATPALNPPISSSARAAPVGWPSAVRAADLLRLCPLLALPIAAGVQGSWLRQSLSGAPSPSPSSLLLMGMAVLLFGPVILAFSSPAQKASEFPAHAAGLYPRRMASLVAAGAGLLAFYGASGNRFTSWGVLAWAVAVGACIVAFWDGRLAIDWRMWVGRLRVNPYLIPVSRITLLLIAVLAVAAVFRSRELGAIPPEMTSDHVEKLLDVNDVMQGQHRVFFERNTGREALQFYFAAWVAGAFGTGPTHLTLKITSALAGFLTIPFIFLLGRELEDDTLGLLGALLAAIGFWPVAISRVGLRFPFAPVFIAPALFFLFRGLRTGRRNDFLWAGLALGAGLHGYSPFRIMAVVVAMLAVAYLLSPQSRESRRALLLNLTGTAAVALAVFIPLLRYALEYPEMFWYRSLGRLSNEGASVAEAWRVFWSNQWNAWQMFNWRGDQVWVNTLPGQPVLDVVTGGLFLLGLAYLLVRAVRQRSLRHALTLVFVPVLMLPSSLSLAFPQENPSVVRTGGAIVLVFLVAAQPLRLALAHARERLGGPAGAWAGGLLVGGLVLASAAQNYRMYFVDYAAQYIGPAQNASEVGTVIRDFAESIGTYDTAVVRAYPHWVDTRAVGMYAGRLGWDNVYLDNARFGELKDDPRPKLYLLHRDDREAIAALRAVYPDGQLSRYHSARPHHDFLIFFVPGTLDLDEATLPPVGSP